jgi:hypothetical protein
MTPYTPSVALEKASTGFVTILFSVARNFSTFDLASAVASSSNSSYIKRQNERLSVEDVSNFQTDLAVQLVHTYPSNFHNACKYEE